jgi:cation diffusion facilitator family transporter
MQKTTENNHKLTALKRSTIAISSVIFVELSLGTVAGSLAIISDGLHALLDALTMFVLLVTTRISLKPPDEEHMYGHEKFESIGGLIGGIALAGVALLIIYEAILKILAGQSINRGIEYVGLIAIGYTFCIDFFRVGILRKSRETESTTMKAGFYHAIADLSSTVIAFLGFGLSTVGVALGDSLASIILGCILSYLSLKLVWGSGLELSDRIPKEVADAVRKEILNTKGVFKCEGLKARKAGDKTYVRAIIKVPDYMNLEDAHDLASKIEAKIRDSLGNVEPAIHIEPYQPQMRTEKLVEKIAAGVKGVKEAHEITTAYTDGKLYITLHARVNPELSVEETHNMAEQIENKILGSIRDVENVTVHIEPFDSKQRKGLTVDENELNEAIRMTAAPYAHVFRVEKIQTYIANNKRFINIDGCFTKQVSIEDAHKIASRIEENIKEHFAETIVTVHMEPK